MFTTSIRRLLAVPLVLAAMASAASASEIRDSAGMFSAEGIRRAEAVLDNAAVPIVIETIPSLNGRSVEDEALARARRERAARVYVLITKNDHKFWYEERDGRFTAAQGSAIKDAFVSHFRKGDFDGGLVAGSEALASSVSGWNRRGAVIPRRAPARNGGGFTTILVIGGIVLLVLFGMRILGSLFGGGRSGYGAPGGMRPGMGGPGMGYGGGGGGGGFFSSLLGGLGGAMAGNWMYDQFRGHNRGGGYDASDAGAYGGGEAVPPDEAGWGGGGGGDWGGGGGDIGGGGGDWGGGGGDWGGGGGGGGGGGDW